MIVLINFFTFPVGQPSDEIHPTTPSTSMINPTGLPSAEIHPTTLSTSMINPTGLPSDEIHPTTPSTSIINPTGLPSDEIHPTNPLTSIINPVGLPSDEIDLITRENIKKGDFVIVQLHGLKNLYHYVARIDRRISEEDVDYEVTYLEKKLMKLDEIGQERFVIPFQDDKSDPYKVPLMDIIKILCHPTIIGATQRSRQISFPTFSFSDYNLA